AGETWCCPSKADDLPRLTAAADRVDLRPEGVEHEGDFSIQQFEHGDVRAIRKPVGLVVDGPSARMTPPRAANRFARHQADNARKLRIRLEQESIPMQGREDGVATRR